MKPTFATPIVISPTDAAARLAIPVPALVSMMRRHRYEFLERLLGGHPGDQRRSSWGLTEDQFSAILRGQARRFPEPPPTPAPTTRVEPDSPDGRSRIRTMHPTRRNPRKDG